MWPSTHPIKSTNNHKAPSRNHYPPQPRTSNHQTSTSNPSTSSTNCAYEHDIDSDDIYYDYCSNVEPPSSIEEYRGSTERSGWQYKENQKGRIVEKKGRNVEKKGRSGEAKIVSPKRRLTNQIVAADFHPKPLPPHPHKSIQRRSICLILICITVIFATLLAVDVYQFHTNVTQDQQLSYMMQKLSTKLKETSNYYRGFDDIRKLSQRKPTRSTNSFILPSGPTLETSLNYTRELPSALIIGARKSGTRALLEALSLHPMIHIARHEIHYFDNDTNYSLGASWYRAQMPRTPLGAASSHITVEKTPAYFTSNNAPRRVRQMNREMKLILIVRQPVERAISDYSQVHVNKLSRNKPHDSFANLVFDAKTGAIKTDYKPIRNSLYSKHLRRWLAEFHLSQIHIVDGDNFVRHPLYEIEKIEKFLRLPHSIKPEQMEYNAVKGFYCFRHNVTASAKCLGESKGRQHAFVSLAARERLGRQLEIYNQRFFDLIQRRFEWNDVVY